MQESRTLDLRIPIPGIDEFRAALVRLVSENPGELDVLDERVDRDILARLQIDADLQHDRRVVSQFLFAHRNPPVN